jgi:YesN/AraC family two-component response regulator
MHSMRSSRTAMSILIVDDDKMATEAIGLLMRRNFPEVSIYLADNGALGLVLFKKYLPEVVITDINMPEMDGIQMASRIKRVKDDVHFFVMTGNSEKRLLSDFSKIGFDSYMMKPIDLNKLFTEVGLCLSGIIKAQAVLPKTRVKKGTKVFH